MDTIFALATARGRAGVAIIRISGPDAFGVASALAGSLPDARGLRELRGSDGQVLDQALVLTFADGQSFTGEPVVELHCHGSPAVVSAVLGALRGVQGARPAEAGEFTRRALENGRLDLTQVEGLADLIDAETESQRIQAQRVFQGSLGALAENWRQKLIRAAALIEATIDFADEEVPVDVSPEVNDLLSSVASEMKAQSDGVRIAERIRDGFEVAIVGPPNAGKSTLLNRLAGRDAAITSEIAGTTRDVIEVRMDLDGLSVTLLDTAGLRDAEDAIEGLGIERARERADAADLRVVLVPVGAEPVIVIRDEDIVLRAKMDDDDGSSGVSGKTGAGVDRLIGLISERLATRASGAGFATRERHLVAMQTALHHISYVHDIFGDENMSELAAEELRQAVRAVDMIVGRVDVEDLLDEIFRSFCIGK